MTRFALTLALALVLPAGALVAQDSPIEQRQALMKKNGDAAKAAGDMVKGEVPYNAEVAAQAMRVIVADMEEIPTLFPEGTETGFETAAKATIWTDRDGFEAAAAKLREDAEAAATAAGEGLEAFKVAFGRAAQNCNACHEEYRVSK